jgi:hypothetical protein
MLEEAIQDRGGGRDVPQELAPVFGRPVRRDQRGRLLVAADKDLEEIPTCSGRFSAVRAWPH